MENNWGQIKPYVFGAIAGFIFLGILYLILKNTAEPILNQFLNEFTNFVKSDTGKMLLSIVILVGGMALSLWLATGRPRRG